MNHSVRSHSCQPSCSSESAAWSTSQRPRTSYRRHTIRPHQLDHKYDVVVIGAGMGGLTCGTYLAKFGAKVLIVDRHYLPGGFCSFFKRKGFYFDAGAHYFGSLGDPKAFGGLLLRALELDVSFIPVDPVDILHFPDQMLELPAHLDTHIELLQQHFPCERDAIRAFFKKLLRIYRHFYRGKKKSELLERYRWASYQDVLDDYFVDDKLKAILSATVGYVGVYPNRVSAISMASMMMSYFYDGGYVVRGGSQALSDSLMRRFASLGGDLLLNTAVEKIQLEGERASSVRLSTGHEIQADCFVANSDVRQTFFQLIGEAHIDEHYGSLLKSSRESNSCFVLYLGLACDDDVLRSKRGWYWDSYRVNDSHNMPLYLAVPTFADRSLCPPGHHILTATSLYHAPDLVSASDAEWHEAERWHDYKQQAVSKTLTRLEQIIPGLSQHIVVQEAATPRTLYRYSGNSYGAMYGWETTPDQFWVNRLSVKTPIPNLLLCSHWAGTGPGVISVVACGFLVAQTVQSLLARI